MILWVSCWLLLDSLTELHSVVTGGLGPGEWKVILDAPPHSLRRAWCWLLTEARRVPCALVLQWPDLPSSMMEGTFQGAAMEAPSLLEAGLWNLLQGSRDTGARHGCPRDEERSRAVQGQGPGSQDCWAQHQAAHTHEAASQLSGEPGSAQIAGLPPRVAGSGGRAV